jgi:alcohol dehydrogenase class IV
MQKIINGKESYKQIGNELKEKGIKKFMLVCRPSFFKLGLKDYFDNIGIPCVYFTDFTVNPKYEEICLGVDLFYS